MNIETARIFCDLSEMRNFTRTADKHGVSQSAVSQQIAHLEITHKCQLVNRNKRPLELTVAGEAFYHACKDILDRYDKLTSELTNLSRKTSVINMAAIFSIGMYTLQPYVKKFMARYPTATLRIEYRSAGEIYDGIVKGDFDIGVVAVAKKVRNVDVYAFEQEPLVLVCGRTNPLASDPAVDIHKLSGVEFIAFDKDVPTRTLIDGILSQYGIKPRITLEFDNIETIKRALEIGAGVSILPETTVHAEVDNGTLKTIRFSNDKLYRPTSVIMRKGKSLTQMGRYLIELLCKQYGDE